MGTTTTPILGLIKPDGNELASNFDTQHAANADVLDARVGDDIVANTINLAEMHAAQDANSVDADYSGSATFVDEGANRAALVFTAPPSGAVKISLYNFLQLETSSTALKAIYGSFEVREGGTVGSGTVVLAASVDRSISVRCAGAGVQTSNASGLSRLVTGLTPGATYNVRTMGAVSATGGLTLAQSAQRHIIVEKML